MKLLVLSWLIMFIISEKTGDFKMEGVHS